jgi:hypothetical protein
VKELVSMFLRSNKGGRFPNDRPLLDWEVLIFSQLLSCSED